jgi:hypothetical protein
MTVGTEVLYVAPGAGLGHVTRAAALSLLLKRYGLRSQIVTNSHHANAVGRLTGLAVDVIPSDRWVADVVRYAQEQQPRVVLLDTFPWGLRGEWLHADDSLFPFVWLARRLNVAAYLQAVRCPWQVGTPHTRTVVALEPLNDELLAVLRGDDGEFHALPGRVRFPAEDFPVPLPDHVAEVLGRDRVWLVVHSGPDNEVGLLLTMARTEAREVVGTNVVAVTPQPVSGWEGPWMDYFPAGRLYGMVHQVVTGAGYNSVAERDTGNSSHLCVPFSRRYDDQAGRLAERWTGDADPAAIAACLIGAVERACSRATERRRRLSPPGE